MVNRIIQSVAKYSIPFFSGGPLQTKVELKNGREEGIGWRDFYMALPLGRGYKKLSTDTTKTLH